MTEPGARMENSSMGESDRQGGKLCLQNTKATVREWRMTGSVRQQRKRHKKEDSEV